MIATFTPCKLAGTIDAPPSKSMAHRYLIGAALSKQICTLSGVDYNEDIMASIDCIKALGAKVMIDGDKVTIDPYNFMQVDPDVLACRESGSTLRFFIPLALCLDKSVMFRGSQRLLERPLIVYESLCRENGFELKKGSASVTVCGKLHSGDYEIRGDVSSQFITGMIFALLYLGKDSRIHIIPPIESRSYINLTIAALKSFGANVDFADEYTIEIKQSQLNAYSEKIEGDYSNAAFLDAFNYVGSSVRVNNLNSESMQGDRVYKDYFELLSNSVPTLDISDCPDLGPILIAMAAMQNGAVLTGTERLKAKESDRGMAMHEELRKLGGGLIFGNNTITVPKQVLQYRSMPLNGHNDHRIVMALSVVLSKIGGVIDGVEAVKKSYPGFFEDIKRLGAEVDIKC